jgi:drug/metabolite transporter (DMT)-like permease
MPPGSWRAVLWMGGALLSFLAIAVSIRQLARTLGIFDILAIRSAAGVAFLAVLAWLKPTLRASLLTDRLALHAIRNTLHFAAQFAWAFGIVLLPLTTAFALEFTMPAWLALLAAALLGERMTPGRAGAVVLGIIGVLVILRPGFAAFQPASLVMLGAALGFAAANVATKKLTRTETTFAILFWMNAMQLPMNLAGSHAWFPAKIGLGDALPLLGIAVAGLSSHYCQTNALRFADATLVVPLDFLRLPLIALIGFWFYDEALDPLVAAGAGCIVAGIVWNLRTDPAARRSSANVRP